MARVLAPRPIRLDPVEPPAVDVRAAPKGARYNLLRAVRQRRSRGDSTPARRKNALSHLVTQAAWVPGRFCALVRLRGLSGHGKASTSQHDSMRAFVKNNIALYTIAAIVIALLFARYEWAPWVGLVFSGGVIAASILYYNPKILLERGPGIIDWLEDITFTGLLFLATGLLIYQVLGVTLRP